MFWIILSVGDAFENIKSNFFEREHHRKIQNNFFFCLQRCQPSQLPYHVPTNFTFLLSKLKRRYNLQNSVVTYTDSSDLSVKSLKSEQDWAHQK